MNFRRSVITSVLVFAVIAVVGVGQYLRAVSRDADKQAALRRGGSGPVSKTVTAGSNIPTELTVGQKQDAFVHGQITMPIMNSELTDNFTGRGWRGSGRNMSPLMGQPSFTVPAGGFDSPLWASACGVMAYLPGATGVASALVEGSFVGTNNVYRNPPQLNINPPTGYWSDLGGTGSAGFALGTTGPGGYREPFITETTFYNNAGVNIKRQSYSFSYGYNHTNDFILIRHVLTATGNVDADLDGTNELTGATINNLFMVLNYDFDIPTTNDPGSNGIAENEGGDDKTPTGFFTQIMPKAVPPTLRNSGRLAAPYGPRVYSGIAEMFDEDDPGISGVDDYIWSNTVRRSFNPLHMGEASLMVLAGNGTGAQGDLNAAAQTTIWGGPSVGLFHTHQWWEGDVSGVFNWYLRATSLYMGSYPGDGAVEGGVNQPEDRNPNSTFFTGGGSLTSTTDISTWVPKGTVAGLTQQWGDPRNLTQAGNPAVAGLSKVKGQYDNLTLFDLDGKFASIVPDPYKGSDRKEITSTTGCDRNMLGWGPFTLAPGQSVTIWQADMVGAGQDGIYDVNLRAQDVWMQRKYNNANDTYYWDGSNDRILPQFNADGSYVTSLGVIQTETVNLGRTVDSGALFLPPPPPTLSIFPTINGTIGIAWQNNAETAVDPGKGTVDFAKYRVYRSSGFIDQFPTATTAHPVGYNSTIIPPSMGLTVAGSPVTDVTGADPAVFAKNSHPYARFIQEGNVLGADYGIGKVFEFVTATVNKFAAPSFAGPYVQIAEFGGGSTNQTNSFAPPATVKVPNPVAQANRFPGFLEDVIETIPSSRQIVDKNNANGANTAKAITFGSKYVGSSSFASFDGIDVDPRLVGKQGYVFEDPSTLIGFNYWYYVASVDNESAMQRDFVSVLQNPSLVNGTISTRQIDGLESFYSMNANNTDGRWHGTFPYRGRTVGPQVPGQETIPVTVARNKVSATGVAEFLDLVTVAPNPFRLQALWDLANPGAQTVKFLNLPIPSRITIFDVAGLLVRKFDVPSAETQTLGGVTSWDLKNQSHVGVSGGLYIAVVEAEIGGKTYTKTLKLYLRR